MSEERNTQQTKKYLATLVVTLLAFSIFITAIPTANADDFMAVSAILTDPTHGATTSYNITFKVATAGNLNYVEIGFPLEANVSGATLGSVSGIGVGVLTKLGSFMRYTLTTPEDIVREQVISLVIDNIGNPETPGNYNINIILRSSAFGTPIIDSGSVLIGTVIPEFPSATMLVLLTMMASALALALGKKHRPTVKVDSSLK